MSKFIVSGFADEADAFIDRQMDVLDPLGIRHIEIRGADGINVSKLTLEQAEEMAKKFAARGYKISAIGSPIGKYSIADDFEPHFELYKHCLELAKIFGTKYIRTFSFYPAGDGWTPAQRDEVMRRWEAFLKAAQGTGIAPIHENEKGIYGENAENCLDLAKTLGIGLIFDPANFIQSGVTTYPDAYELLKDHIVYMHVKDAKTENGQVVPSGYGDGRLKEIIGGLDKRGFNGYLSLEPHLSKFTGFAELEPDSPLNDLPEGGPKMFNIAATALFTVLDSLGIERG